ncbi:MAG: DNA methyltransferase [Dehalococcoidia bacterium]
MRVQPIPILAARWLIEAHHYSHSLPGGTRLAFGVFVGKSLLGALTLGVGPFNAYRLVSGAGPHHCMTLTRLWLSDELPRNSESRTLGLVLRALKRHTSLKFLVTYADPAQGHLGIIYQATNWAYTGLSEPMPLYDLGDGKRRHSRSLSHAYGTHSLQHFANHDVPLKLVPQNAKYRYVFFLDRSWRSGLRVPVLPYPKGDTHGPG